jgi:HEPN domain-containing protein
MSSEKNHREAQRWLDTSRGDLATARILRSNGRYAHACFHAQQAAEKALKSLWYRAGQDPWGHSVQQLIEGLAALDQDCHGRLAPLMKDGALLDRFYIPTRYPNGLPDVTPDQAYFEDDARSAIEMSERLIERVTGCVAD